MQVTQCWKCRGVQALSGLQIVLLLPHPGASIKRDITPQAPLQVTEASVVLQQWVGPWVGVSRLVS